MIRSIDYLEDYQLQCLTAILRHEISLEKCFPGLYTIKFMSLKNTKTNSPISLSTISFKPRIANRIKRDSYFLLTSHIHLYQSIGFIYYFKRFSLFQNMAVYLFVVVSCALTHIRIMFGKWSRAVVFAVL